MSQARKRTRRRKKGAAPASSVRTRAGQRRSSRPSEARPPKRHVGRWILAGSVVLALVLAFVAWARRPGPGGGARQVLSVEPGLSVGALAERLARAGLVRGANAVSWYLLLTGSKAAPGHHLLRDDLSPRDLAQRLARTPGRPHGRVTIPEGYNHQQIALRLAELEVCTTADFQAAVFDPALLAELKLRGPSAEGYLFPATYELPVDSDAASVVRTLVGEARKRLGRVAAKHPGALEALATRDGLDEHDVVTLASIVEREAADPAEHGLIASVFFNRLRDPSFLPAKALESDPTAAYGCLVEPNLAPSCAGFHGQVTPALLRDAKNRYNTYRHPGVPPGPIANPGESALAAVLAPAQTDYFYFVASGHGHHRFSRTFEEHKNAIAQ